MNTKTAFKSASTLLLAITLTLPACSDNAPNDTQLSTPDEPITLTPPSKDTAPETPEPTNNDQSNQTPTVPVPEDWPADVGIAPYMNCVSVTKVRDDFMVTFHAPDTELQTVADWFKSSMTADGWTTTAENKLPANTTLVFNKDARTCGITITNFILNQSMQRDDTTCGITIQTKAQP